MPKFKSISDLASFTLKTSILCGLLEKTCFLSELTGLHDPFRYTNKCSGVKVSRCLHPDSLVIPLFLENNFFLHLYQFPIKNSEKMVIFVYAYFIVKNEVNQCERYTRRIPFSQKSILFQDNPPLIAISIRSFFTKKSLIFHLEIIKSVLLVILQKSEHKGFTGTDVQYFIQSSSFRFLSRLHYIMKTEIPYWIQTKTWTRKWSHCGRNNIVYPRYYIDMIYYNRISYFKGTPCLHCPVQAECTPQGSINPFECEYLLTWESDFQLNSSRSRN
jgi:hypothetical protein